MKAVKSKILIIISMVLIAISIGMCLYPTFSRLINNYYAKGTVEQYNEQVTTLPEEEKENMLSSARSYNKNITNIISDSFSDNSFNSDITYAHILCVTNDGQIGNVEIPSISCNLPIYHGNVAENLDKGAVHMPNTSFPIGGDSTHSVISAHTAYPGKEFFNKLIDVKIGDLFYVTVLGDKLTYQVSEINTVLPEDTSLLEVVNDEDLVTLVTCTPYSVNTHRLLVRGKRLTNNVATPSEKSILDNKNRSYLKILIILAGSVVLLSDLYRRKRKRVRHEK